MYARKKHLFRCYPSTKHPKTQKNCHYRHCKENQKLFLLYNMRANFTFLCTNFLSVFNSLVKDEIIPIKKALNCFFILERVIVCASQTSQLTPMLKNLVLVPLNTIH